MQHIAYILCVILTNAQRLSSNVLVSVLFVHFLLLLYAILVSCTKNFGLSVRAVSVEQTIVSWYCDFCAVNNVYVKEQ